MLVVVAGQVPPGEVTSRFQEGGFASSSLVMDSFTKEEFQGFVQTKGITDPALMDKLARMTNRVPHVARVWFEIMGADEEEIRLFVYPNLKEKAGESGDGSYTHLDLAGGAIHTAATRGDALGPFITD